MLRSEMRVSPRTLSPSYQTSSTNPVRHALLRSLSALVTSFTANISAVRPVVNGKMICRRDFLTDSLHPCYGLFTTWRYTGRSVQMAFYLKANRDQSLSNDAPAKHFCSQGGFHEDQVSRSERCAISGTARCTESERQRYATKQRRQSRRSRQ